MMVVKHSVHRVPVCHARKNSSFKRLCREINDDGDGCQAQCEPLSVAHLLPIDSAPQPASHGTQTNNAKRTGFAPSDSF